MARISYKRGTGDPRFFNSSTQDMFATALVFEGGSEGETCHFLLTWRTAKQSSFDGNLSRLVLGATTKKSTFQSSDN